MNGTYSADETMPIRIREDCSVRIAGIPHDITAEEVAKIVRVIQALAPVPPKAPRGRKPRNASEAR